MTIDFVAESIQTKYNNGEITYAEMVQMTDVLYESIFRNPIAKHMSMLEDIRKTKPSEYDGPKEVKKFVDKNYADIMKIAAILEKEPNEIRKNEITTSCISLAGMIGTYASMFVIWDVGIKAGTVVMGVSVFAIIVSLVSSMIEVVRVNKDIAAINNLTKVKKALNSASKKKLDESTKKKISELITAIDDAETECREKIKTESVSDGDIHSQICEAYWNDEISEDEYKTLLNKFYEVASSETGSSDNVDTAEVMNSIMEAYANDSIDDEQFDTLVNRLYGIDQ